MNINMLLISRENEMLSDKTPLGMTKGAISIEGLVLPSDEIRFPCAVGCCVSSQVRNSVIVAGLVKVFGREESPVNARSNCELFPQRWF